MSNERAAKIAKLLRDRTAARGKSIPARIVDMTNFWTRGILMADLGTSVVTVVARTLDCLRVGDHIFIRRMEHERWSDYVYDGFDQRPQVDGSPDYYPGYCPHLAPIVIWDGAVAAIPTGWALCDGENGTPDLRGFFVIGTSDITKVGMTDPGSPPLTNTHYHIMDDSCEPEDSHPHADVTGVTANAIDAAETIGTPVPCGGRHEHGYTWTTLNTGPHDHQGLACKKITLTWETRPPFYALCYIMALSPQSIPLNGIVLIPAPEDPPPNFAYPEGFSGGWNDIAFPVGVDADHAIGHTYYPPDFVGGPFPYPIVPLTAHGHFLGDGVGDSAAYSAHVHHIRILFLSTEEPGVETIRCWQGGLGDIPIGPPHNHLNQTSQIGPGGEHVHGLDPTIVTDFPIYLDGGGATYPKTYAAIDPPRAMIPYLKVVVDQGEPTSLPVGSIILWQDDPATLPDGWMLCDGSDGSPDLRGRMVIGAGGTYAVGETGGSAILLPPGHVHDMGTDPVFLVPDFFGYPSIVDPATGGSFLVRGPHQHDRFMTTAPSAAGGNIGQLPPEDAFFLAYNGLAHTHDTPDYGLTDNLGLDDDGIHEHLVSGSSGIAHTWPEIVAIGSDSFPGSLNPPNDLDLGYTPTNLYPAVIGTYFIKRVS